MDFSIDFRTIIIIMILNLQVDQLGLEAKLNRRLVCTIWPMKVRSMKFASNKFRQVFLFYFPPENNTENKYSTGREI